MVNPDRYTVIDKTLKIIHTKYVALPIEEKKINSEILHEILKAIIEHCRDNELFNELYRAPYFGGSYYENLKIKRPDEYDIHIKLCFPPETDCTMVSSCLNGYVHVEFSQNNNGITQVRRPYYGIDGLHVLINEDSNELDSKKVMLWMHQIVSKWLGGYKRGKYRISKVRTAYGTMQVKLRRSGPALTFQVTNFADIFFNFDFVPCFQFGKKQWPIGFRRYNDNPEKCNFYVIPKSPKGDDETTFLRTSFQEQDREILYSREKLKPAFRLIKKLRDKLNYENVIVSFFIKNVFLWEANRRREQFWNLPLGHIFITMLEKLQRRIEYGTILYFWEHNFNLIEHIEDATLFEISEKLTNVIDTIKTNLNNPFIIAQCLLTSKEYKQFKSTVNVYIQN